jgi:Flp pilus assembly protein TadB
LTALVAVIHAGLAAAWVGGMAYSLFVVQPKLARFYGKDEDSREALTAVIASGNRWKVLGLIAAIGASGIVLWLIVDTSLWIHVVKTVLLIVASGIFWYVSWRHWPRRIFATAAERPALQRQLRILATTMLALAATAFALGVLAAHI